MQQLLLMQIAEINRQQIKLPIEHLLLSNKEVNVPNQEATVGLQQAIYLHLKRSLLSLITVTSFLNSSWYSCGSSAQRDQLFFASCPSRWIIG